MRFLLNGCDICLIAEAPEDMTVEQLVKLSDRIKFDYCACGVRSLSKWIVDNPTEVLFTYDDLKKVDPDAPFTIKPAQSGK